MEYGFLSVLQASASASVLNASVEKIEEILLLEKPDLSMFTEGQLEQVRAELFHSLGTCSFDEPRGDLRRIGMLKEE